MRKNIFFRNFETKQTKIRFFVVLLVSFFCQIHLAAAVHKGSHFEDIKSNVISYNNANIPYSTDDLEENTVADSTNLSATVSKKQLQANVNKRIPSKSIPEISDNSQEETEATIFVSSGAIVFGLDNVYNTKLISVKDKTKPEKISKPSLSEQINVALSEKKAKIKLAQATKEKKLQEKVDFRFSFAPVGSSDIENQSKDFFTAVISSLNVLQKSGIVCSNLRQAIAISWQIKKQKFYTFFSYLQFGKLRNSFLRGPPAKLFS